MSIRCPHKNRSTIVCVSAAEIGWVFNSWKKNSLHQLLSSAEKMTLSVSIHDMTLKTERARVTFWRGFLLDQWQNGEAALLSHICIRVGQQESDRTSSNIWIRSELSRGFKFHSSKLFLNNFHSCCVFGLQQWSDSLTSSISRHSVSEWSSIPMWKWKFILFLLFIRNLPDSSLIIVTMKTKIV